MKRKIFIFHEYGNKSHYRALLWKANQDENFAVIFREFSIIKNITKSLIRLDIKLFVKQFKNIIFIFSLLFAKKTIIVGIAPFDWRLLALWPLLGKHNFYYHTSHTNWNLGYNPKKFLAKSKITQIIWSKFIRHSLGVYCATSKGSEEIKRCYQHEKVSVVNHSIPVSFVRKDFPERKKSPGDRVKVLFVGRYTASKGMRFISEIIRMLPSENFSFSFVGQGELVSEIDTICSKYINCTNYGYQKNNTLQQIYDQHDVLLLPSIKTGPWEELFGMVLIEAMSRGVVPIATNHTGPREVITNAHNGYLFSEDLYIKSCHDVLWTFYNNPEKLNDIQKRSFIQGQQYAPDHIYDKWQKYFIHP